MADTITELEVLNQIVDVLGGQSGQYETVVPTLQQIKELLGGGGGGGGYNPSLSVGRADALTGADSTAQWAQRESAGSGAATVRSVQGAAVAWNQISDNSRTTVTTNGITFTNNGDGSITVSGTATDVATFNSVEHAGVTSQRGHIYLLRGCPADGSSPTYKLHNPFMSGSPYTDFGAGCIYTDASADSRILTQIYIARGATVENLVFRPQLFDLTQMFGRGNEPTTIAEFEAMYPASYYPYSAPTLKPVQIAGIRSTDAQGGELDSVEWTAQTLRAAGNVRDMLYSDHVDVRVGVVDLGTLKWRLESLTGIFEANIADMRNPTIMTERVDGLSCALYPIDTNIVISDQMTDKTMKRAYNNVYIRDTSYTTVADFKSAMSGVLLFYELATPTTTPISPALPMTYRVQAGGSESIIVPDGEVSAAPIITAAEGESAAELVMDALAAIAAPDGPVATANHAINTYLTMGGKLYKVTRAIAVGETIAAGTNVTQTTVMAELIARTA